MKQIEDESLKEMDDLDEEELEEEGVSQQIRLTRK